MFRNYLTVAIRAFLHRKLYSFINISGLAISLACATFIALFIRDELSWDAWEPDSANVWQLTSQFIMPDSQDAKKIIATPRPLGPAMKSGLAEVVDQTRIEGTDTTLKSGNRQFHETIELADPNFFQIIRLPFIYGSAESALSRPDSIVLTQKAAQKYFGTDNVLGRTLTVEGKYSFRVSAVLKNPRFNSQFRGDIYISEKATIAQKLLGFMAASWLSSNSSTFIRLVPGAQPETVLNKLKPILRRNVDPRKYFNTDETGDQFLRIGMIKLRDVHLEAPYGMENGAGRTLIRGFSIIAVLILCIACFNFTNLSTACASLRIREISLRKTLGASKNQLVLQHLGESVFLALIAMCLALTLVEILHPAYNGLLHRDGVFSYAQNGLILTGVLSAAVLCGLLGGLYPAIFMSRFRPGDALKSGTQIHQGKGYIRNGLVTLQFTISIGLGISATAIYAQIHYANQADLGYSFGNLAVITTTNKLTAAAQKTLVHRLRANPDISGAALSDAYPLGGDYNSDAVLSRDNTLITARRLNVSPEYIPLYHIRLLAGRNFSREFGNDKTHHAETAFQNGHNVIIDSLMAAKLGMTPDQAVGKTIITGNREQARVKIIGVISPLKFYGVMYQNSPLILKYDDSSFNTITVALKPGLITQGLRATDREWNNIAPGIAIDRHFIQQTFDDVYEVSRLEARIFAIFVGITLFTACMGLFGLAAFTAERRKKEISIRKVFGATKGQIIRLLLWRFSVPVIIANVIAWPVAYLWLHHWLEGYAYHIDLGLTYFIVSGVTALVIAWLTISANAWQTASTPPAHALRSE